MSKCHLRSQHMTKIHKFFLYAIAIGQLFPTHDILSIQYPKLSNLQRIGPMQLGSQRFKSQERKIAGVGSGSTIQTLVIWEAIARIMTSLYCCLIMSRSLTASSCWTHCGLHKMVDVSKIILINEIF